MTTPTTRLQPVRDRLDFLKAWLRNPAKVGAVLPSSRGLAAAMAREIDPAAPGVVVELGGGTGTITQALLDAGVVPERLVVIEQQASFCEKLRERFPRARVIRGNAGRLRGLLRAAGVGPVKAVVSGLPLLSLPKRLERLILAQTFAVLAEGGHFVQFTYGPKAPVTRSIAQELGIVGTRSSWILENFPPAFVWTYRRREELVQLEQSA